MSAQPEGATPDGTLPGTLPGALEGTLPGTLDGTLLGGAVAYRQFAGGYRTGMEPVLLAACVPARAGERVVEGGTGAGAGLLCLSARVSGLSGVGLELDADLARLAAANFSANGRAGLRAVRQDVMGWRADAPFDHALANPPWHRAESSPSADGGRRLAKQSSGDEALAGWVQALAAGLRRRGTLSLILPAASMSAGMTALRGADCGEISVLPLWIRAGASARLVVLRGVRSGRGDDRLLPGLCLHTGAGDYTDAAEAVLRGGASLM